MRHEGVLVFCLRKSDEGSDTDVSVLLVLFYSK